MSRAETPYRNVLIAMAPPPEKRRTLEVLARHELRGRIACDADEARDLLAEGDWDLVLLDLDARPDAALALLGEVRAESPELPVVALAGENVAAAVGAMRRGCRDVLTKPLDAAAIDAALRTLLPNHKVPFAAAAESGRKCLYEIAGQSGPLLGVLETARKIARTSMPVLVTGESGTGKELVSYFVHRESSRRDGPYVRVNCAALSESLLESELFGHERGAFTGASRQRKGRFERAHGGTLLLDEISETTPRLQAELLRVLEQQDFERVGGTELVRVNVRVVCTSNRDLPAEVRAGRFRRDLYYRIGGIRLELPPLRQRKEDIPPLTWHFVNQYAREVRRHVERLDEDMLDAFECHDWPGNVRELRNVVRTALALGEGPTLSLAPGQLDGEGAADASGGDLAETSTLALRDLERQAIFEALRRTKSHQAKAARLLGITDRTLREKLRRYRREGAYETSGESRWLVEQT